MTPKPPAGTSGICRRPFSCWSSCGSCWKSHDLADRAAHAAGELQEAVRCIRESARKYENVELEPELTRPGEGSGAVWLAAAAAKLLAQVPTHEEWACRERIAIDRHIADGKRRVRELTEQLSGLPRSRRRV